MQVITIYSPKGGVGKTALAFALTKELDDCYYVTNDKIGSCIALEVFKNNGQYIGKNLNPPIGIKTIVFVGGVLGVIGGYFVLIFEKFHLFNPWISNFDNHVSKEQGITILIVLAAIVSLITLAYAYFKLKEKEAQ